MREKTFQIEDMFLSMYAKKSKETLGRDVYEEPCSLRTDFQRDRDRIIHCKAFRRLKNKTQVFFSPEGDDFRTRLTHTLNVSQVARSLARALSLNEDLTEAIALGHDLGHTPFGHSGERVLNSLAPNGFKHNEQSKRVVEVIENSGRGLNLTKEVRDGILNHKMSLKPSTLEGRCVSIADWIAYINHDIEDAISAKIISFEDLPVKPIKILGATSSKRINTMIYSVVRESAGQNKVEMEEEVFNATKDLRDFMFEHVYYTESTKKEEEKAYRMISNLYDLFKKDTDKLPEFYRQLAEKYDIDTAICDYISGMSDRYAVYVYDNLFIPKSWSLK